MTPFSFLRTLESQAGKDLCGPWLISFVLQTETQRGEGTCPRTSTELALKIIPLTLSYHTSHPMILCQEALCTRTQSRNWRSSDKLDILSADFTHSRLYSNQKGSSAWLLFQNTIFFFLIQGVKMGHFSYREPISIFCSTLDLLRFRIPPTLCMEKTRCFVTGGRRAHLLPQRSPQCLP